MKRFLIIWAFLAAGILAALSGIPERPHANLLGSPFSTGGAPPSNVIQFQNKAALGDQSSSNPYTASYTTVSNVNTGLILAFKEFTLFGTPTATYNSVACAFIGHSGGNGTISDVFGFYCPVGSTAPGAHNIVVTNSTTPNDSEACIVEYSGVAQTTATEGVATNTGTGTTTASVSVTTAVANDWVIGLVNNASATQSSVTAGAGFVWRSIGTFGVTDCFNVYVDSNTAEATGTYTPSLIFSPAINWGIIGFGLEHG